MANLFFLPYRPAYDNAGGLVVPGAQVYFTNTAGTPKPVYSNSGLTVQRSNPVVADGVGKLPTGIYMDPAITYRVRIYSRDATVGVDTPLQDFNPYVPGVFADATALQPVADAAAASAAAASTSASAAAASASAAAAVAADATAIEAAKDAVIAALAAGGSVTLSQLEGSALPLDLKWFGATGNGTGTGDAAAMTAALAYAFLQTTNNSGANIPTIRATAGTYLFGNTTFDITYPVRIEGESREGTVFKWNDGVTGFRAQSGTTTGATGTQSESGHYGKLTIRNLTLDGSHAVASAEAEAHAIHARTAIYGEKLLLTNWAGDGVRIIAVAADPTIRGNANLSTLTDVLADNCRWALNIYGADVNGCTFNNVGGMENRAGAIYENGTLGNTYIAPFSETNALWTQNDGVTLPASHTSYGGQVYVPRPDQVAACSTNAPSGTTADNAYWLWWKTGGAAQGIPAWTSGLNFRVGGGFYIRGAVNGCVMVGAYCEGNNVNFFDQATLIIGAVKVIDAWGLSDNVVNGRKGTNGGPAMVSTGVSSVSIPTKLTVAGSLLASGTVNTLGNGASGTDHELYFDSSNLFNYLLFRTYTAGTPVYEGAIVSSRTDTGNKGLRLYGYTGIALGTTDRALAFTNVLSIGSTGFGYASGMGGAVTQATSKSTAAPALNKPSGEVTMNNASLAAGTVVSFTMANSCAEAKDLVNVNHVAGGTIGAYTVVAVASAGTITFYVRNNTAGALAEALVLRFALVKGQTS